MKNIQQRKVYVGDFETTVYKGQTFTEVWASAVVELFTEEVKIFHSIEDTYNFLISQDSSVLIYYHNLKFDGSFWLDYLLIKQKYKHSYVQLNEQGTSFAWNKEKDMKNHELKYSISDRGQWYSITFKERGHLIEIRDSLKLLPFSVREIGNSFKTKHHKLDMEYTGFRFAGCEITDEEKEYIANDVLVVKEALETMYEQNHKKLTIGACCLAEFKTLCFGEWDKLFPDLVSFKLDPEIYTYDNADAYIRKSYKGGWCYVVPEKTNKLYKKGTTADVNSLYPSMMSSESGNKYPTGLPKFWKGDFIPDEAVAENKYFFVRIKTRFYIKENMLPFVQIKGSLLYDGTEALITSDYYDKKTNKYYNHYYDRYGELHDTRVTLTFTMTDYKLFLEHYNVCDFEILDGCWFYSAIGIFDAYIDKYKKIKIESKGALRTLAKLFLNNLYGKMASSTDSSFKVAYIKDDNVIGFMNIPENNKSAGYIAVGSAITSYARNFTIRTAQKNYYGKDKRGFIYADTDSIHCDLQPEELVGVPVHESNFCCWKLESTWDEAIFVRQKTYIEHVVAEDLEPIEHPYYNVKCAGMPQRCKELFLTSMGEEWKSAKEKIELDEVRDYEEEFINNKGNKRTLTDFKIGLTVPSKLMPKRIQGGVLLVDTTYQMR